MRFLFTLFFCLCTGWVYAQDGYAYVVAVPTHTADELIPAYHTIADTVNKPYTKLFRNSKLQVVGKLGTRWAVVEKAGIEYVVRTSLLPNDAQQVVANATVVKTIPTESATGRITYSEVVQVPGATKAELYARAKLWFASTFKSAADVVQADDKDAGILQGTGFEDISVIALGIPSREKLWYTVKIALKDGRYKYDISEFRVQGYPNQFNLHPGEPTAAEGYINTDQKKGTSLSIARSARRELALAGDALATSITTSMSKPAAGTSAGKDW